MFTLSKSGEKPVRSAMLLLCFLIAFFLTNCQSDQSADQENGLRKTNAELVFVTRGSLEGEITANG